MLAVKRIEVGRNERPWVARIEGSHPRYGWARTFLRPLKDFSEASRTCRGAMRGLVLEFLLPAGVYEVCQYAGKASRRREDRRFFRSADGSLAEMTIREVTTWIQQNAS